MFSQKGQYFNALKRSGALNCKTIRLIELMSILIPIKIWSYCKLIISSNKTAPAVVPVESSTSGVLCCLLHVRNIVFYEREHCITLRMICKGKKQSKQTRSWLGSVADNFLSSPLSWAAAPTSEEASHWESLCVVIIPHLVAAVG